MLGAYRNCMRFLCATNKELEWYCRFDPCKFRVSALQILRYAGKEEALNQQKEGRDFGVEEYIILDLKRLY